MTNIITTLLVNLYESPWPKTFDASPFFLDEDLTPVIESKQIGTIPKEMQNDMGKALLEANEHLKGTPFHDTYLLPIYSNFQTFKHAKKIKTKS